MGRLVAMPPSAGDGSLRVPPPQKAGSVDFYTCCPTAHNFESTYDPRAPVDGVVYDMKRLQEMTKPEIRKVYAPTHRPCLDASERSTKSSTCSSRSCRRMFPWSSTWTH